MAQDSSRADFWDTRYRAAVMPWDQHGVPAQFATYIEIHSPAGHTLIPGCGAAYEARYLAARGHNVLAIDFSPAAIDAARPVMGEFQSHLQLADFFDFKVPSARFELVYERAFLCALPPRLWPDYAHRMAQLVPEGGKLAGYFFLGPTERGPPFAIEPSALQTLLSAHFEQIDDAAATDSIPIFKDQERWQVWQRR
jgi:SAM-dependent methyltransferase